MVEKFTKSRTVLLIIISLMALLLMLSASSCSDNNDSEEEIQDYDEATIEDTESSVEEDYTEESDAETEPPIPTDGEIVPYDTLVEPNIVYKTVMDTNGEADLKLDIYYPTNRIYYNNPTIVAFHGGAWVAGSRSDIVNMLNPLFDRLRANGYTVVTVQYRYASEMIYFPSNLEDCIDAILFLTENKDKYNIDTENIGVTGYSAGAHLAMLCTYAMKTFSVSGNYVDLDYCVSLAGPTKLYEDDASAYPRSILYMLDALFNGSYEEKTDDYKMGSPYYYLNSESKTPLMIIQGNKDEIVPYSQSELMFNHAEELGIPCEFITLEEGKHRIDLNSDMTSPTAGELINSIEQFIYKYTVAKSSEDSGDISDIDEMEQQDDFMVDE